jgi:hypothetical protein
MIREIIKIPPKDIIPSVTDILKNQGISKNEIPNGKTLILVEEAIQSLIIKACPVGILMEISKDDFEIIYNSEGMNEFRAPLDLIYKSCVDLAIFIVTVGEDISREIAARFDSNDLAKASMLDSAASKATERAAGYIESYYKSYLERAGRFDISTGIMRFSPGYCGWHIGAQKNLFGFLKPQEIGITLNESLLMQPLKSISGVIISGRKDIFIFDDNFSFCAECVTHSCRDRIQVMIETIK